MVALLAVAPIVYSTRKTRTYIHTRDERNTGVVCGRTKNGTNVRKIRRRVLRYVAVDEYYNYNINYTPFVRLGRLAPARQPDPLFVREHVRVWERD